MRAIQRRMIQGIKALAPEITVEVASTKRHQILVVSRPGVKPRKVSTSVSPKNEGHAILNAIEDARRALELPKRST